MLTGFFKHSTFPSAIISFSDGEDEYRIIDINTAYERLFGYTSEDVISRSPALLDQLQFTHELLENGLDGEKECVHKNGTPIWVHYSIFPIRDENQKTLYYGVILFDISEKKELEATYNRLSGQFLNLIQNVPSMIYRCALDEFWTTEFMSDYIYDLSGYPLSDFIDNHVRSYASIIHPDDVEMVDNTVREAVAHKKPFTIEYRIVHADGNIRYVYEKGQATFGEGDEVSHLDGVITDITDRVLAQQEIERLAFYDPLTRLPNRRLLLDRLYQVQLGSERNQWLGALMFLDLDTFKELNDTMGHDYGDILLQQVAQRLSSIIRKEDTVARLGGDEFVIVLKELSDDVDQAREETTQVADKIMSVLNAPYLLKSVEYKNSPSIGITMIKGTQHDQETLLKQADQAMYDAKKSGRNTYRFFHR